MAVMTQSGDGNTSGRSSYLFGPFAFHSAIPLPELPACNSQKTPNLLDVTISLGNVPSSVSDPSYVGQYSSASAAEFLLDIEGVARYYVLGGAEIRIQPDPLASELDVRGYLLSNIFAVLCHQRRLLPLHASAVKIGAGVVAFLGTSGAGKSTLAAFLAQAGYPLVADDICLLDPQSDPEHRVLPVAPWLKLWRGSLEALGKESTGLAKTFTNEEKFRLPTQLSAAKEWKGAQSRLPLRALIVLQRSEDGAVNSGALLTPVRPVEALTRMMEHTYQAFLLDWLGLKAEHFASCGRGLEGASAYTLKRPWSFDSLPDVLACLKKNFE